MTIDLLHEHVRWFGCEVKLQVEVQRQRRVALVSPPEQDLPLLSDIEPDFDPVVLVPEPEQLRGLYAGPTAPSADPYMLEGLPQGRTAAVLLAVRSLRLLASAWARRSGRQLRLPREGDLFLDALAEVDLMLLWARPRGMLRDRWVARTTWWAAKVLGVRTGLGSP
jgi:hypothetical protein